MTDSPFGAPNAAEDDVFSVDLTDAQSSFQITPGTYPAKVIGVEKGLSKTSGNPMFTFTFVIMSGEFAGREFKNFCSLSPAAAFKLAEVVTALGLGVIGSTSSFTRNQAINKAVMLKIEDDTYQGEDRSTIKKVLPHPDGPDVYAGLHLKDADGNDIPF